MPLHGLKLLENIIVANMVVAEAAVLSDTVG